MISLRNLFLSSLAASSLVLAQQSGEYAVPADSQGQFQDLLEALPAESLHAALHSNLDPKFVDGVYEHEKHALEALQNADPPMATRVLAVAALELLKRQASSNTTAVPVSTTTTPVVSPTSTTVVPVPSTTALSTTPSSTAVATPSSTSEAVVVPVEISTTNSVGSTIVATTSAVATPSASITQVLTTTDSAGSSVVSTTTAPAAVIVNSGITTTSAVSRFTQPVTSDSAIDITTTDAQGQTVVLSSVTVGKVITATDGRGSTFVTTYTPGAGGSVNSLVLLTTTLPNGVRSTITSFAVVAPASSTATGTNTPKLQNAARRDVSASGFWTMAGVVAASMFAGGMLLL